MKVHYIIVVWRIGQRIVAALAILQQQLGVLPCAERNAAADRQAQVKHADILGRSVYSMKCRPELASHWRSRMSDVSRDYFDIASWLGDAKAHGLVRSHLDLASQFDLASIQFALAAQANALATGIGHGVAAALNGSQDRLILFPASVDVALQDF